MAALAALVLVLGAPVSRGSLIEYQYGGVITSADPSSGVVPGERFSGTFAYDPTENPPGVMIEGSRGYEFGAPSNFAGSKPDASALSLTVGGAPVLQETGHLSLNVSEEEYAGDNGYKNAKGNPVPPSTSIDISSYWSNGFRLDVNFNNPSRAVLGSLLPPKDLTLGDFPSATLVVTVHAASPETMTFYQGTIDTLTPVPVPEPVLAPLFGLAAAAWFARVSSGRSTRRAG